MKQKVSIVTITYNQKNYTAQALKSFASQKTNFPFTAIVAEDCLTENTQKIIREYTKKYSNYFKNFRPYIGNKETITKIAWSFICAILTSFILLRGN